MFFMHKRGDYLFTDCQTTYLNFVKKRTDEAIGKQECPDRYENFKDLYEEYLENHL